MIIFQLQMLPGFVSANVIFTSGKCDKGHRWHLKKNSAALNCQAMATPKWKKIKWPQTTSIVEGFFFFIADCCIKDVPQMQQIKISQLPFLPPNCILKTETFLNNPWSYLSKWPANNSGFIQKLKWDEISELSDRFLVQTNATKYFPKSLKTCCSYPFSQIRW